MLHRISIETAPYFYDQRQAFALLRARRWGHGRYCPRCKSDNVREVRTIRILEAFSCNECRYNFTTTADTFFHSGRTPVFVRLQMVAAFSFIDGVLPKSRLGRIFGMKQSTVQRQMQMLEALPRIEFTFWEGDLLPFENFPSVTAFLEQPSILFSPEAFDRRIDQLLAPAGRPMRRPSQCLRQPQSQSPP